MKKRTPKKTKSSFGDRRQKHNRQPRPHTVTAKPEFPMRLNKYIAHCGICARRQAAEHVKNGEVKVNGELEKNLLPVTNPNPPPYPKFSPYASF